MLLINLKLSLRLFNVILSHPFQITLKGQSKLSEAQIPKRLFVLNRLIEKINVADDPDLEHPVLLENRLMVAGGTFTRAAARTLIRAYEKAK